MASSLKEFSTTAGSNTTVGSANIAENCAPSGINNAAREIIAYIIDWFMNSGTIASATTTDLGTKTQNYLSVTGTATITGFGTPTNKTEYTLTFAGILTLTHNATSLILPGGANITTAAGDVAVMKHEGSGNWRCVSYTPASGVGALGGTTATSGHVLTANGSGSAPTWQTPNLGGYAAKTAGYTVIASDNGDIINWTTAGATASLTAAATLGSGFTSTLMNSASTGDVTIDPDGAETIDGLTTRVMRPGNRAEIVDTGSAWITVSGIYSSAPAAITTSSTDVFAHGLPTAPIDFGAYFVMGASTELGYTAGDRVPVEYLNDGGSGSRAVSVKADATNVTVTWGSTEVFLLNTGTGSYGVMDYTKWTVVLWARL